MIYRGHIKNGKVVFDADVKLADGTAVRVETLEVPGSAGTSPQPLYQSLENVIGVMDLPEDFAAQHDHYVHGTPKK